jgi:hypothetical protein
LKFIVLTSKTSFSPRPPKRTSLLCSSNMNFHISFLKLSNSSWTIIN